LILLNVSFHISFPLLTFGFFVTDFCCVLLQLLNLSICLSFTKHLQLCHSFFRFECSARFFKVLLLKL
jgi:hypothetical protein